MKNKLIILNVLDKTLTIWVIVKIFMLLGIVGGIDQGGSYKKTDKKAEITCNFCNNKYEFDEKNLKRIISSIPDIQ